MKQYKPLFRNHKEIAETLERILPEAGLKREDIFITSKLSPADQVLTF